MDMRKIVEKINATPAPENPTCCGLLERLFDTGYTVPLSVKNVLTLSTGKEHGEWMIDLYSETPTGRINMKDRLSLTLKFCPFCGAQIYKG